MKKLNFPKINNITLAGRLTANPELRHTKNNKAVCSFTLAFDDSYKVDGQWVNDSNFITVVNFGDRAEDMSRDLEKGDPVIVDGRLQIRKYQDKENNTRNFPQIIAFKVYPLEREVTENKDDNLPQLHNLNKITIPEDDDNLPQDDDNVPF